MKDPYTLLGVARAASQGDIKKAYRKLAKELHPDRNPGHPRIADKFKEISAAYHILGDEKLRARFDRGEIDAMGQERGPRFQYGARQDNARQGRARPGAAPDDVFAAFGGAENIFGDLFGGLRRGAGRARGADRKYALTIGFIEAVRGARKRLTLPEGKTLDVTIPAGVADGQPVRLKGQGEPGFGGGPAGDALIEVKIEPHAFFTRQGADVHVELPVTLGEAVAGARIAVPTIDGMVTLNVPKDSNTGTTLRLKERGIVDPKTGRRGNQYVKLKIVLPDRPDPALHKLVEAWSKGRDYDVRAKYLVD